MTPARQALEKLLRRGENARARGSSRRVMLAMTPASCPIYCGLDTLEAVEVFHAEVALAERADAITIERQRSGGDSAGLKRLLLTDLDRLGEHLGIELLSDRARAADVRLAEWRADFPVVVRVLQRWREGGKVRGSGPESADDLVDALTAVQARRRDQHVERILRRESIRLYADSKRLERLTPWLDVLTSGELTATGLAPEDIWGSLGLRREPQPMLVAGRGLAKLHDGNRVALVRPYLGLPVDAIETIETDASYLLTIENLASFHDAARAPGGNDGLLVYTAGMPTPSWRALYARLLATLPPAAAVYHWGDIDEGGFRIAAVLAQLARETGLRLEPWLMSPTTISANAATNTAPSRASLESMIHWARKADWQAVALELQRHPMRLEQEALDPRFPPREK